jgi:hypothetical protein
MNGALDRSLPGLVVSAVATATIPCTDIDAVLMALVVTSNKAPSAEHGGVVIGAGTAVVVGLSRLEDMSTRMTPRGSSVFGILLNSLCVL